MIDLQANGDIIMMDDIEEDSAAARVATLLKQVNDLERRMENMTLLHQQAMQRQELEHKKQIGELYDELLAKTKHLSRVQESVFALRRKITELFGEVFNTLEIPTPPATNNMNTFTVETTKDIRLDDR